MILRQQSRHAALPRLVALVAILLTGCGLQPQALPTPTLIVLPSLTPSPPPSETPPLATMPEVVAIPSAVIPTPEAGVSPTAEQTTTALLPSETPAASPTTLPPVYHTVVPGESLYSIAAIYGVSVSALEVANNIADPNLIFVGQKLLIPPPLGGSAVSSAGACTRDAVFVTDVTIPDNTPMLPGQTFVKTWRVRNTGTCPWDNSYTMIFAAGNQMGAPSFIPLPLTAVGATADISISMTAPSSPGKFISSWQIRGPDGIKFGPGPYVLIAIVPPGGAPPTMFPTTAATAPPPPSGSVSYPPVSGVDANSRQIYLAGQQLGNRRDVFAKIGDSLSDEPWFLHQIGDGQAQWGSYGNLAAAAAFFSGETARTGNSFNDTSVATHGGWDSFSPLDPANSTPWDFCGSDSPIVCELRVVKPSVALIMVGTNEASDHLTSGAYEQNLRKMVQISIDRGVIPVLYTIPWNKFRDPQPFNVVITRVARSYDIPLVDFWSVIDPLPNHGISSDGVHPSVPPDQNTAHFSSDNLQYGYTVRNLVTMELLDVLYRTVLY